MKWRLMKMKSMDSNRVGDIMNKYYNEKNNLEIYQNTITDINISDGAQTQV